MNEPGKRDPEEIDQDLENIQRLWNGNISNYVMEKRYIRRDGSVVWGRIGVSLIRGQDGEPQYINGVLQDITQQKKLEERLREKSRTDGLTGLYTHSHFMKCLNERLEEARRYDRPLGILMLDIDHFKGINDRFGHPSGDNILRRFSRKFREVVRQPDLPARYGGEEFAVLLPETTREEALSLGERIRRTTESMVFFDDQISITLSGGAASYPEDAGQTQKLLDRADAALYRAKNQGRNRICSPPS